MVRIRSRRGERCHGAVVQGQDHVAVRVLRHCEVACLASLDGCLGLPAPLCRLWIVGEARGRREEGWPRTAAPLARANGDQSPVTNFWASSPLDGAVGLVASFGGALEAAVSESLTTRLILPSA